MNELKVISSRQKDIVQKYLSAIDKNLDDLVHSRVEAMYEIEDFASILHIQPRHLSNTVKWVTGNSPCALYEEKIIEISKKLILQNTDSIANIAKLLTYDPSNFTKFFKKFTGKTPKIYREEILKSKTE